MRITPSEKLSAAEFRCAFTVMEVLIAVMVMTVVFVSLYLGFSQGFAVIQMTRENLRATQILEERTEVLRLYTWDQINNSADQYVLPRFTNYFYPAGKVGNQGIAYFGEVTITNAGLSESYNSDLRQVIFQVTWTSGNIQHTRRMSTLVSRYGLHNYLH